MQNNKSTSSKKDDQNQRTGSQINESQKGNQQKTGRTNSQQEQQSNSNSYHDQDDQRNHDRDMRRDSTSESNKGRKNDRQM